MEPVARRPRQHSARVDNWHKSGRFRRHDLCAPCDPIEDVDALIQQIDHIACETKWAYDSYTRSWRYMRHPHLKIGRKHCPHCTFGQVGKSLGASRRDRSACTRDVVKPRSASTPEPRKTMESCPICMSSIDSRKIQERRCGHTFCKPCLLRWQKSGYTNAYSCPICRQK